MPKSFRYMRGTDRHREIVEFGGHSRHSTHGGRIFSISQTCQHLGSFTGSLDASSSRNPSHVIFEREPSSTFKIARGNQGQSKKRRIELRSHLHNDILDRFGITGECAVCLESTRVCQMECCQLSICPPCLDTYLSGKVDRGVINIVCPGPTCDKALDPKFIKRSITTVKSKRLSFLRVKADKYENRKACPMCSHVHSFDDPITLRSYKKTGKVNCSNCKKDWCVNCNCPWHVSLSCQDYKMKSWANGSKHLGRRAQQCPGCGVGRM